MFHLPLTFLVTFFPFCDDSGHLFLVKHFSCDIQRFGHDEIMHVLAAGSEELFDWCCLLVQGFLYFFLGSSDCHLGLAFVIFHPNLSETQLFSHLPRQ
jgi:hypothetical protein